MDSIYTTRARTKSVEIKDEQIANERHANRSLEIFSERSDLKYRNNSFSYNVLYHYADDTYATKGKRLTDDEHSCPRQNVDHIRTRFRIL